MEGESSRKVEKSLKQDEIDALFQAARARSKAATQDPRARVEPYSFSRAGQISNEQLRAISLLNDIFARNLTHNLGVWLRSRFRVNLVSAEQMPFNEFMMRIPDLAYVGSVRLEPLRALSVLQLDLALAPPVVDLLLGGEGRTDKVRELTDIEESILTSVAEVICRELSTAWQPVGLSFVFERRQLHTQIARMMPVSEKTLCLSFEIQMPGASGMLNLAFPAVVSNTVLRRLTGDWSRQHRHSAENRQRMQERLKLVKVGASLQLPPIRIQGRDLDALCEGQILRLPLMASHLAELRVAGVPLFEAHPVQMEEQRAAHLARPAASVRI
ncbi:MAG: FliM/FliN family flagellar motor switch protein [Acidobacterium ailaaui]|nr:FliM/FliN family flagellar motor switch protein [Pseudacidobacterium ailaaui]MCL6463995.1 FliM/FliN family flagellar motor switch protein [Pseudacidobacterium ailaaui]